MSGDLKADLADAVRLATRDWKKAKKRQDRVSGSHLSRMRRAAPPRYTIKDAAFNVMERAYNHASSNGRYYANARQIMYAARPLVLEATDGKVWSDSSYFTQRLLKDYLERRRPAWKVVWDARGHLYEPHTGRGVSLGGVEVMKYAGSWWNGKFDTTPWATVPARLRSKGPSLRFGAALFIEKEGFGEILKDAGIAERYDLAIFSSKGLPVGAACDLARSLRSRGVKILAARDFDLAGFKAVRTLRKGTRLTRGTETTDIGLRLEDVEGLESEPVNYNQKRDPREYLRRCGASSDEMDFLVEGRREWGAGWHGRRVELNAMTSQQLVTWLESKLNEHGVEKVVPDADVLGRAYHRAVFRVKLESAAKELASNMPEIEPPDDLDELVRTGLDDDRRLAWDEAVAAIADENYGDENEEPADA